MIKALHMDDRLIHGQVAISWTRTLGVDLLLVVNDEVVGDMRRRNALKLGVPAGVKYGFRSVADGIDFLNDPANAHWRAMVLVNNPHDVLSICQNVSGIERVTVGGLRKDAPMVADNLNLTDEDVRALKDVLDMGIEVGIQPTPEQRFRDLRAILDNR